MQAIIFDCDGTLVDSETLGNEMLVELAREHGVQIAMDEALLRFRGEKMGNSVAYLESLLGERLPPDFVPTLRARSAVAYRRRLCAIDGALELVRSLTLPMCVASSGPLEKMQLTLSITGLLPFFEGRLFSSYEIGSWKPDPALFLHAAHSLGVNPASCAVVEDSLPGVEAGIAAGMQVFALHTPGAFTELPPGVTPIGHLSELQAHID